MPKSTKPEGELFHPATFKNERNFTETGWGRFPIPLENAKLDPVAFALYCHLSIACDRHEDPPSLSRMAELLSVDEPIADAALDVLLARNFVVSEGDDFTLTDPKEWQP